MKYLVGALMEDMVSYSVILPSPQAVERAVKVLDHIPPYDTHKIGVIYVGQGQVCRNI